MDEYNATLTSLVREALLFSYPQPRMREDVIRNLPEPAPFNLVHIITGMRRCGKTFYLFQLANRLVESGVLPQHAFYFNFADDRLSPAPKTLLGDVVEEYYRQVPSARVEGAYLFLDEVQEVQNWQGACQRIAEHERVTLTITGSSSKVSSEEIATSFRGRSHSHEMLPLSFREFCTFHEIAVPDDGANAYSQQEATRYESLFDQYLIQGGFPGVQTMGPEDRIEMLQSYVRDVVARDVAERTGRGTIMLANHLALFGLRNTACDVSINNLVAQLQDAGHKAYWQNTNDLLELLRQAYLFFFLEEYATALKPESTRLKKVYAIDPGVAYAVSRANQQDIGKRFETAVYLELRRRNGGKRTEAITSLTLPGPRQQKVDFLMGDALSQDPYDLVQASVTMQAPKTRERELGSLSAAMAYLGLERGTVITLREQGTVETDAGAIEVVPAWRWALERP